MIENILNLVLGNVLETSILIVAGLLVGVLFTWIYYSGQVNKRERRIKELETNIEEKETDMSEMRTRAQELMNERGQEIDGLNSQLENSKSLAKDRGEKIEALNTQLENSESLANERQKEIESLNMKLENSRNLADQRQNEIVNLNTQLKNSEKLASERGEEIENLNNQLEVSVNLANERQNEIESLNTQLSQRDENISDLNQQISEKDESIDLLKRETADLEQKNQDAVNRAEGAETRVDELAKSLEEKEQEATALKDRIRRMQDDFTHIAGIGPKVSSVLMSAGINTFAKLASSNEDKLKEILEAENPRLLRLTDPSTWPDQARLASEEDWEALKALQESLKGSRRT